MAYYLNIVLLFILGFLLLSKKEDQTRKKIFVAIASLQWILLSGLRHLTIGADTSNYFYIYNDIQAMNWNEVSDIFFRTFQFDENQIDGGYYLFVKMTQMLTDNYQLFLLFVAILFMVPFAFWVYENSSNVFISYLLYSIMFYSFFSITGIRQTIATALAVFIGYRFIKHRELLKFLLVIFIAFTFHRSALIFIPFYFLRSIKLNRFTMMVTLALFFVFFYFRVSLMTILAELSGYKSYGVYEGAGTFNFTLLLILVFIISFWRIKIVIAENIQSNDYFLALCIALLLTPLSWVNPNAMRTVQYFSIFLTLLIPEIIKSYQSKEQTVGVYFVILVLLSIFIRINPYYLFFWE